MRSLSDDFGGVFKIPENFSQTASPYHPSQDKGRPPVPQIMINPQTVLMCDMLGITDPYSVFSGKQSHSNLDQSLLQANDSNDSLLDTDDEGIHDDSDFVDTTMETSVNATLESTFNPDEISLDDIGDEDDVDDGEDRVNITGISSLAESDNMEDDLPTLPPLSGSAEAPAFAVSGEDSHCQGATLPGDASDVAAIFAQLEEPDHGSTMSVEGGEQEDGGCDANTSRDSDTSLKRSFEEDKKEAASPVTEAVAEITSVEPTQNTDSAPTMSKKFKRRNQAIYTATEDS